MTTICIYIYLWQSCCLHQWGESSSVSGVGVRAKGQKQLHTLQIQGRHQINLRTEEVSLVWIGASLQQRLGHFDMTVSQSQAQWLVAQSRPTKEDIFKNSKKKKKAPRRRIPYCLQMNSAFCRAVRVKTPLLSVYF